MFSFPALLIYLCISKFQSVWRTNISCKVDLAVSLAFTLGCLFHFQFWKTFAVHKFLGWQVFPFTTLKLSLNFLLAHLGSLLPIIFIPSSVTFLFSLATFKIFSLSWFNLWYVFCTVKGGIFNLLDVLLDLWFDIGQ